jgi:sugar lactone lactonase YvrE
MLKSSLAAGSALLDNACTAHGIARPKSASGHPGSSPTLGEPPIRAENRLPGTDAFALRRPALANEVEGYASLTSAVASDSVEIKVNVDRAQQVRWELYRIGHYQGLGARLIASGPAVAVSPQPPATVSPHTGLMECAWQTAFSVVIDPAWVTGYYLLKLTNEAGFESYVPMIVRESGRRAPLLAQASVTTWQAYNLWGGLSLYVNRMPAPVQFQGSRAFRVSFDRPYLIDGDIGGIEYSMVRWLEKQGYDVAYVTNVDIDESPALLSDRLLFMTIGHDEYWSLTERNAVQDARDAGLSLAFFSGNTAFRRIRLEPSSAGVERRVVTCYKSATRDPRRNRPDTTSEWNSAPHARPENELVGLAWTGGWGHLEGFPFVVTQPDHWVYEGTGVRAGDTLGQIIGVEWDTVYDNGVGPTGIEIISESSALHEHGYTTIANASVYYPTPTSFVFAAGTITWAKGLSAQGVAEPRVQRATENILRRAGLFPETPVVVPPVPPREPGGATRSVVLAGSGTPGSSDGPAAQAGFYAPAGVAAGPNGDLYVCDTDNRTVRKLSKEGQVSTLIGAPPTLGLRLSIPTGIATDAQGNVFVSDTGNNRIVVIDRHGVVDVHAGRSLSAGFTDSSDRGLARFNVPRGLCVAPDGALYVADFRNDAIRRIDAAGVTTVVSGAGGPTAVAVGPDGTLYYVATWDAAIVSVSTSGVRRVLANPSQSYGNNTGPGMQARLRPADGLIVTDDALLFTDTGNNRIRSVAFDEASTVTTVIGSGRAGNGSGLGSKTELSMPRGLAAVPGGYVVADTMNHRILFFRTALGLLPSL